MEAENSSEMLVNFYDATRRARPQHSTLQTNAMST